MKLVLVAFICYSMISCEDYLEVDAPDNKIVNETVFSDDVTAISSMKGIYNELFRASFSGGWENSVNVLAGLTADELQSLRTRDIDLLEFQQNEIATDNSRNLSLWSSAYNIIYMTNALLTGLETSGQLTEDVAGKLQGEAKFVRAFTYFYLVNLYGEVPLLLTTDYRANALAPRNPVNEVYEQIILDLEEAISLLSGEYAGGERTMINRFVATAMLARVNLYTENWEQAEMLSSQVIASKGMYEILEDPNQVFLANSKEAVWQLSPEGRGGSLSYTNEGLTFLFHPIIPSLTKVKLSNDLMSSFEQQDKRLLHWTGYYDGLNSYFAFKYKDRSSMNNITEYSMVLRFAEQYLIRAEARAMQENISGAIADLDQIRERAGLDLIAETSPEINQEDLMDLILEERRKELFTEWGHRWLDLKRTERVGEVLGANNPTWQETDVLFPIPEEERMKNPNLGQNPGY